MRQSLVQVLTAWLSLGLSAVAVYAQAPAARKELTFSVTHYDVQLEPRLEARTVTGTVTLSVVSRRDDLETIALNRGRLEIASVQEDGRTRAFVVDGNLVRITLPRRQRNARRTQTVSYRGEPSSGARVGRTYLARACRRMTCDASSMNQRG